MQLHQFTIGFVVAIATITIAQGAVWSFTIGRPNDVASMSGNLLALEPETTGGAASRDVDAASQGNPDTQQPTVVKESDARQDSTTTILHDSQPRSTNCQFIPQTRGNALKQLDALSKCNSSN